MYKQIELGDTAQDLVTGFSGMVVGITEFITGCKRITLQPPVTKSGEVPETQSFDEPMLKVIKKATKTIKEARGIIEKQPKSKGGPQLYKVTKY